MKPYLKFRYTDPYQVKLLYLLPERKETWRGVLSIDFAGSQLLRREQTATVVIPAARVLHEGKTQAQRQSNKALGEGKP